MQLDDFDFDLPPALIAQYPPSDRGASRLLDVATTSSAGPDTGLTPSLVTESALTLRDRGFRELPSLLRSGDLLVVNNTRVIKARLLGVKADSGGRIEALIERVTDTFTALVQLRASKTPREGTRLAFDAQAPSTDLTTDADPDCTSNAASNVRPTMASSPCPDLLRRANPRRRPDAGSLGSATARVLGRSGAFFLLAFDEPVLDVLERYGRTPLPPYITHAPGADDDQRYQTVYAREPGAVAAPTAGLHFDDALFDALRHQGVERAELTLHVGAGTFQPVRVDDLSQHQMHSEHFHIDAATIDAIERTRARGGRVVAVGTTTLRALESAAAAGGPLLAGAASTQLFITPGYRFRVVDQLITNFHLPRSTLLMLVSAFAGTETIRRAYAHAIANGYRFFSYGDAMLLTRKESTGC